MFQHQNLYPYNSQQNYLPTQQILQVNGKDSLVGLKLAANSSVLIADSKLPLIYKCVSDSLGNIQTTVFDVTLHKDEEEIKMDSMEQRMSSFEQQLAEIKKMIANDGFISG